jgi:hypothetical protein
MKRILSLILCLGLASAVAVAAKDNNKRGQKARKVEAKVAKQGAKFDRKVNRAPAVARSKAATRSNAVARSNAITNVARGRSAITRRGPANFSWSYNEARRNHHRGVRRDRAWYSSRYNRFALFAGGYYYFDRGYWYPAYGYDPVYSTYRFDEPIYGYNSLDPSQVIVNVQSELRRQGYYRGSIDGLIGPMTRSALARYQGDRGLSVTRAIDGPTLAALGLT